VLILSLNNDWADELISLFGENQKIEIQLANTRSMAMKLISDTQYDVLIFEDSYRLKNINVTLRALESQKVAPKKVYFCFSDFNVFREMDLPQIENVVFKTHSLPIPKQTLVNLVLEDLFPYGQTSNANFDLEFIQVLIKAASHVFSTFNIESLKFQKPLLHNKIENKLTISIRGKIMLKHAFFNGSFFISFPQNTFLNLYEEVVGSAGEEINSENRDFAGELANMVFGHAKKELEEHGVKLDMALPVLDQSEEIVSKKPIYVVPVQSSLGDFYLKVAPEVF
jgi:chemotaxis protein CheX